MKKGCAQKTGIDGQATRRKYKEGCSKNQDIRMLCSCFYNLALLKKPGGQ